MSELKQLYKELSKITWVGADEGWDLAITEVLKEIKKRIDAQPEATKPAQDLGEAVEILDSLIESVQKHGNYTKEGTLTILNQLKQCLASPAEALVAGDRVDAKDAALEQAREALHVMLAQFTKTPSTLHDTEARCAAHEAISTINAAIQAQKDGHANNNADPA